MGDIMRPVPFEELLTRIFDEYQQHHSIFGIPEQQFYSPVNQRRVSVFGESCATPIGPAAGPHTQLAQNIIATVSQPYSIEGTAVVIGVSIGISSCPQDGVTADALIRNADLALYAAKGNGRGVHRFYRDELL